MSGFSIDWLDLREGADQRARDNALLRQAGDWLSSNNTDKAPATVVDLGSGTGSTLRAFFAGLGEHACLSWRLVDQDADLLAEAKRRHGQSEGFEVHNLDLANIPALPLGGADLIAASALFDLVSADFIDRLAAAIQTKSQQQPLGFYGALNYDGITSWKPKHPLDDVVLAAFNRDQRRDKGFGPALGPDAGAYMEQLFKDLGFLVFTAQSPWKLEGDDCEMVNALIEGIAQAVSADADISETALQEWIQFRKAQAATGACTIGHTDVLALPTNS